MWSGLDSSGLTAGTVQGDSGPSEKGKQCCEEAMNNYEKQHGQRRASGGNVVCCYGELVACSWAIFGPGVPNQLALKILQKCVLKYEEGHFDDVGECNHCMGEAFIMPFGPHRFGRDIPQSEFESYTIESNCLFKALSDGECQGDKECEKAILDRYLRTLDELLRLQQELDAFDRTFGGNPYSII